VIAGTAEIRAVRRHLRRWTLWAAFAAVCVPGSAVAEVEAPRWEWGPSVLLYVLPDEGDYLQPTLTVDRGRLHLEGRYNYEDRRTGSVFVGSTFAVGEALSLSFTPMLGVVFGKTRGLAPALTWTLDWGPLSLWSQSELVVDLGDRRDSFFYNWSELSVPNGQWWRIGAVVQRTRAFETRTEVQAGPLLGLSLWRLTATAYLFAPGQDDQFLVVAAAGRF
jgi:hypothetical protein